jgi:histidinol-phosphate aminotransferase
MKKSVHGGEFFDAIGNDFATLERSSEIINADVLDAWFDPSPKIIEKIREYLPFILRTSPPNYSEGLIKIISHYRGVSEENILAGEGSSELIFLFFQHLVEKNCKALILDPTYGEYQHVLENLCKAEIFRHMLQKENEFKIQPEILLEDIKRIHPNLIVLVNPNSPTGKFVTKGAMLSLLDSIPKETLIVIDETYIEYAGKENSLEDEVSHRENLVIIKSMSKVYALSGARIGYLVAPEYIVEKLSTFLPPWSVSLFGQIAAVEALKDEEYYNEKHAITHALRKEMAQDLSTIPSIKVFDSVANFYLVELLDKTINSSKVYEQLKEENIYVRNPDSMSTQFEGRFIRIAVKDRESNVKIADSLRKVLNEN